ncbi:uracil-DNA glycosylase [Aliidiomarina sanyensis]|uniref:Uracil-DNA glycosylase n=1 Tax=Aliidiomarina sanyensis TaxID=1249555 RepID=A0A432WG86_9GAMM|nr:uracil-DNA glycosylase [Aliidiomarina sanyensis]RUO32755.1 uracil-DNA glycosylase [Aliidiomarina sanyensis]
MESWAPLFDVQRQQAYFRELRARVLADRAGDKPVYPAKEDVFRAFQLTPANRVKVVILGQDPYHQPGQAHGLAFSVPRGVTPPPSLKNIYKAIQHDDPNFQIPTHGDLSHWAEQGVLLLNTALTVREGEPASHARWGWQTFTQATVEHLNQMHPMVFMLWGKHAQTVAAPVDRERHYVLESVHPSPLSAHRGFLTCGHFRLANEWLVRQGHQPIRW